jgi:Protein of unknown function (DUF4231)
VRTDGDQPLPVAAVSSPATRECDHLIAWYGKHAAQARERHRVLEIALLVVGASISVFALAWPGNGVPAAVLGGVVVVLTGLRQVFHWQENYVRFTSAWQTLKQERRRYEVGEPPYDDSATRDQELMEIVNSIEAKETQGWADLMESRPGGRSSGEIARGSTSGT